jgi:hypothetical protein
MTVRLYGTPTEVAEATCRLTEVLDVVAVSDPFPDRGASLLVRVDLEVRLGPAAPAAPPLPTGSASVRRGRP